MSKPRYFWYGIVKKMILNYPYKEESQQTEIYDKAIKQALKDIEEMDSNDGGKRREAVELMYIQKTRTIEGAAIELYCSEITIKRWTIAFVKLVGKYAGF